MMSHWLEQQCRRYAKGQGILTGVELEQHLQALGGVWKIVATDDNPAVLQKQFSFESYQDVLAFVANIGSIAEEQDHHPDMTVRWGDCTVSFCTHSAGGITFNDLICAHLTDILAQNA